MKVLEKWSFVLAPVCLFAAFFSSAVLQNQALMSVLIALATVFLILAVAGKILEARRNETENEEGPK